eukprot:CAMPEP_0181525082 /NCGR_PEP_ID=MMETSP1110-20121109/68781_1 /TAXON_ID=174948 /ORGANISM="Symbiodinium sp., Strain CCMP421" /LENGTH=148 /DNA_ID=CAMNT_0023655869 /DNA_START=637 /DNA_END=1080 /DNA_ORIENTATION=+
MTVFLQASRIHLRMDMHGPARFAVDEDLPVPRASPAVSMGRIHVSAVSPQVLHEQQSEPGLVMLLLECDLVIVQDTVFSVIRLVLHVVVNHVILLRDLLGFEDPASTVPPGEAIAAMQSWRCGHVHLHLVIASFEPVAVSDHAFWSMW